jgi:hypothetical protein
MVRTHVCEKRTTDTNAPCCRLTPECCACVGGWCCNHHRLGWQHAAPVEGDPESAAKRPLQDQSRRRVEPTRVNRCYGMVRTRKNCEFHLADRDRDLRRLLRCLRREHPQLRHRWLQYAGPPPIERTLGATDAHDPRSWPHEELRAAVRRWHAANGLYTVPAFTARPTERRRAKSTSWIRRYCHLCTTLYTSLVILYSKYTEAREK